MPITGPKPKPPELLRQAGRSAHDWIEVPDRPYRSRNKPRLPRKIPALTRFWWQALSSMPHCVLWGPSDWAFAVDTAVLHAAYAEGALSWATEIRQREKVMGTTVDARRDLRIRYVSEVQDDEPAPLSIEERRRLIAQ